MSYRKYPEMKESGDPLLGELPQHWGMAPVWTQFKIGRGRVISNTDIHNQPGEYPVYSSQTENDGILGCIDTYDFDGDYITWTTDGAKAGTVFRRSGKFNCTNVCGTLKAQSELTDLSYYLYALNEATTSHVRLDINPKLMNNVMARIIVPTPPHKEQTVIGSYLDRKTATIDALIAKKQRQIELLQEKRQIIINNAVTKGLDPNVPMKDSGVEWIGEIPEDWAIAALNFRYEVVLGKMLDEKRIVGTNLAPYLRNIDVQWDSINIDVLPVMDFNAADRIKYCLKIGDLLTCEGGEVGRSAIWLGNLDECYFQKALHRLRPRTLDSDVSRFMYYVLWEASHSGRFIGSSEKATIYHLTAENLRRYRFAFPPKEEQLAIVEKLDRETDNISYLIGTITRSIATLREYRTILISNAVTGKIDLRDSVQEEYRAG